MVKSGVAAGVADNVAKGLVRATWVLLGALSASAAGAFEIEDYFRLKRVSELALSSDGRQLVYVVDSFEPGTRARVRTVYLQVLSGSTAPARAAGKSKATAAHELSHGFSFAFVPGTHDLAFLCREGDATQVCVREASSRAVRAITRSADDVETFLFAPNGKSLAYAARPATTPGESLYDQFRTGTTGILIDPASTSSHDFLNPHWNATAKPRPPRLWVSSAPGSAQGEPREVSVPGDPVGDEGTYFWSPDSRSLSVTYVDERVPASWMRGEHTSVGVLELADGGFRPLAVATPPRAGKPWVNYKGGEWIPGRPALLLRRVVEDDPWVSDSFPSWAVVDISRDRPPERLTWREIEAYPRGLQFIPRDSSRFLVENTVAAVRSLWTLDASGSKRVDWLGALQGSSSLFRASEGMDTIVFVNESLVQPPEIYVRQRDSAPRRISNLNSEVAQRVQHRAREVSWKGRDGALLQGWLLEPVEAKRPWPTITHVHGGPAFPYPDAFAAYFAYWPYPLEVYAANGIAVFLPNYRGTHTFGRRIASPAGNEPFEDILTGVEHLVATGIADRGRLGISGHSHGAVVGPQAMGAYRQFAAASFAEGVANSVVMYEVMSEDANREIHDRVMGASLYEDPQRYLRDSPGLQLSGIETASLFEGGAYTAGLLMLGYAKATRRAGVPTEFILYPKTAHNIALPQLQLEAARRNLDWFAFWLQGRVDEASAETEQFERWKKMKAAWEVRR